MTPSSTSDMGDQSNQSRPEDSQISESLKSLFTKDPSTSDPHYFLVHGSLKVLTDNNRLHPDLRKEVMPSFPTFAGDKGLKIPSFGPPSYIADRLRPYTSLLKRFTAIAFKEIDRIETELVVHEHLSSSERSQRKMRLLALTNGIRPVWENWLRTLDEHQYRLIDHEIRQWLSEPIDFDECDLFKDNWDDALYGAHAAKTFFDQVSPLVRSFLGIEQGQYESISTGKPLSLYMLTIPIKTANQRAKALHAKFRFKSK